MKTKIILEVDQTTGQVSIHADNLPDGGQAALHFLMRAFAAAQNVVCDQLEEKRLVIAKMFKPLVRINGG